jgi:RimJ/RimL family protein N-acetyltransferase
MVDGLIDWAKDLKTVTRKNLVLRHDNVRAINLYLMKGFSFEGRIRGGICVKADQKKPRRGRC